MIVFLFIWDIVISFLAVTALLSSCLNYKEIESIKSWYPFCEIMKMKIGEKEGEKCTNITK